MLRRQFLNSKVQYAGGDYTPEQAKTAEEILVMLGVIVQEAIMLDVTNVSDAYVEGRIPLPRDFEHFEGIIPPWPVTWLEWESRSWTAHEVLREFIIINTSHDPDAEYPYVLDIYSHLYVRDPMGVFGDGTTRIPERRILGPILAVSCSLDREGRPSGPFQISEATAFPWLDDNQNLRMKTHLARMLYVAFAALMFANCRNVEKLEVRPTRQQRRAAERRKESIDSYYVLAIDGKTARRVYGKDTERVMADPQKRLHICRGHFATYTEEKPLFGKYAGRFWIPMHTRGSADLGTIQKDYRVV